MPWNCPTCRAPQSVSPAELARNYTLEQLLEQITLTAQPSAPTVNQLHSDCSEIPEDINARLPP